MVGQQVKLPHMDALICLLTLVLFLHSGSWQFGVPEYILVAAASQMTVKGTAEPELSPTPHISKPRSPKCQSVSQSSRIILDCLIGPLQLNPTLKRRLLCLYVLADGMSEDPSHLGTGGRVTSLPFLPHPSVFTFVRQTNQRPGRHGHVSIPPPPASLGYHGNEHWSRQHLAVVRRREGGRKAGGEAERDRGKEGRENRKRTNPSQRNIFKTFILCLSSLCAVSTSPLLSSFKSFIIAE